MIHEANFLAVKEHAFQYPQDFYDVAPIQNIDVAQNVRTNPQVALARAACAYDQVTDTSKLNNGLAGHAASVIAYRLEQLGQSGASDDWFEEASVRLKEKPTPLHAQLVARHLQGRILARRLLERPGDISLTARVDSAFTDAEGRAEELETRQNIDTQFRWQHSWHPTASILARSRAVDLAMRSGVPIADSLQLALESVKRAANVKAPRPATEKPSEQMFWRLRFIGTQVALAAGLVVPLTITKPLHKIKPIRRVRTRIAHTLLY